MNALLLSLTDALSCFNEKRDADVKCLNDLYRTLSLCTSFLNRTRHLSTLLLQPVINARKCE